LANNLTTSLNAWKQHRLIEAMSGIRRGIERETLRVDDTGKLSQQPHPSFLGSKLCHPLITTDFSEAQPELITPPSSDITEPLGTLDEILRYMYRGLDDEVLWCASMPCVLQDDSLIPLADYGESNLGKLKKTYRHGLGVRYGRGMQTICAIHYNFSLPDAFWHQLKIVENDTRSDDEFRSARYFDLMRNFRRFSWLLIYLFGASPAVCNSFVKGRNHNLVPFDEGSMHRPYATSLRSGNLGYQSNTQADLINVCYNSLGNYVTSLAEAITTKHNEYAVLGVPGIEQVNGNILQSEAEFYTSIRAKCVPPKGQNFLVELLDRGVEYLEVRLLDINPYLPLGIDEDQMRFMDSFLLFCLAKDSPEHDELICNQVATNMNKTVNDGRAPDCLLDRGAQQVPLNEWALEILAEIEQVAAMRDQQKGGSQHVLATQQQIEKVNHPELTPSARILHDMKTEGIPFFRFAMNQTLSHKQYFEDRPLSAEKLATLQALTDQSDADQAAIDQHPDEEAFETYLQHINGEYLTLIG